jgi:hypothetical protein
VNHPDPDSIGMVIVSREEFYAYVGPRNIITSAEGSSKGTYGIWSSFKTTDQREVGRIYTSKVVQEFPTYMLSKELPQ